MTERATIAHESLVLASANLLNLARPNRSFYANQEPYTEREFERKIDWLGDRFATLNADALCVQEVWDESALKAAVGRSGLRYASVVAPGAENEALDRHGKPYANGGAGAIGTPAVGLVTRLEIEDLQSLGAFEPAQHVAVPEIGTYAKFERAPLWARLRTKHGFRFHLINVHLKSKRPKFLQDAQGTVLEDREDPNVVARATLRSLIIRAAEAAALRAHVVRLLKDTHEPLVLMGDFNDAPSSVTSQMIAATQEVAFDRSARDIALWPAHELQSQPLKKDVGYSHVHQGSPELLDQIWVSEEFAPGSRFAQASIKRIDYFNDHLHEGRDRSRSDHGFARAVIGVLGAERST